jgi:hypothetical protein
MKKKNILRFLFLALILSSAIISCTKEEDPSVTSGDDRDKFLGAWHVSSHHTQFGDKTWDMNVTASNSASDQILISNFNLNSGTTTTANVDGSSFTIPSQVVSSETIKGSGTYSSNGKLSFSYTSNDGIATDTVTATAQR